MEIKTPPASYYIKKAAKLKSGSNTPGRETAGSVTVAQDKEIAEAKMKELNIFHKLTLAPLVPEIMV